MSSPRKNETILWNALFEASWDGMVVLRRDGRLYRVNHRYAEMLGYTREELESMHVWDLDTRFSRSEIGAMLHSVDGDGALFETRQRRKDGTLIDVELSNHGATYQGIKLIFCIVRDITAREEFMVLLPETGLAAAGKVAEKLRRAIADHRFEGPGGVTASFGVAQLASGEDSRSLAQRVDEALYRAKALGRNRVES
ncbi:MAG: sensor domain-containing diguanylate cyclase [Pseudomonadota bacterium]